MAPSILCAFQPNFNSTQVRLEGGYPILFSNELLDFNSTQVRLEASLANSYLHINSYFNSTQVRLEACVATGAGSRIQFQFHSGTIRSRQISE